MSNTRARIRRAGTFGAIRKMAAGLRALAGGAVLSRTILRINYYLRGRVKGELRRHVYSGRALETSRVIASNKAIEITVQDYYTFIKWSFAKGIPASALNRAKKILGEELAKVAQGGGGDAS